MLFWHKHANCPRVPSKPTHVPKEAMPAQGSNAAQVTCPITDEIFAQLSVPADCKAWFEGVDLYDFEQIADMTSEVEGTEKHIIEPMLAATVNSIKDAKLGPKTRVIIRKVWKLCKEHYEKNKAAENHQTLRKWWTNQSPSTMRGPLK